MKTTLLLIIFIGAVFYVSDFSISLKPFKIKMNWYEFIGTICFLIALGCLRYSSAREARIEGYNQGMEDLRKEFVEVLKEEQNAN